MMVSMGCSAWVALVLGFAKICAVSAAYDPTRIVANIDTDCPIPNVQYPPTQFSVDTLVTVFTPLATQIPRPECVQQATSLAVCAFDGTLAVQTGCCSIGCSNAMVQLNSLNCFPDILHTLCKATPAQQAQILGLIPVLTGAAERCANYRAPPTVACPDGRVLSTGGAAAPASGAMGAGTPAAEGPMPEMMDMMIPVVNSTEASPGPSDLALTPEVVASPAPPAPSSDVANTTAP